MKYITNYIQYTIIYDCNLLLQHITTLQFSLSYNPIPCNILSLPLQRHQVCLKMEASKYGDLKLIMLDMLCLMSHWIWGDPILRETRIGMHRLYFRCVLWDFEVGVDFDSKTLLSGDCCERLTHDWQIVEPSRGILDLLRLKEDVPGQGMVHGVSQIRQGPGGSTGNKTKNLWDGDHYIILNPALAADMKDEGTHEHGGGISTHEHAFFPPKKRTGDIGY